MRAAFHDLIHALTKIKQLEMEEARIRQEKRRMFKVAARMIDEMVKDSNGGESV